MSRVSKSESRCKIERLTHDIRRQINLGILRRGDKLEAELALASRYEIGIKLVRQALAELEAESLIVRRQRSGTFVSGPGEITDVNVAVIHFEAAADSKYYGEVFRGIEEVAEKQRCHIQIHPIQQRKIIRNSGSLLQRLLLDKQLDGVLLLSWIPRAELEDILGRAIPVTCVGFEYRGLEISTYVDDIETIFRSAWEYLAAQGKRRIGVIAGSNAVALPEVITSQDKIIPMLEKCAENGPNPPRALVRTGPFSEADGFRMMLSLLNEAPSLDAAITVGNELSEGAFKALVYTRKLDQVALLPLADAEALLRPPLFLRPIRQIGRDGLTHLLKMVRGRNGGPQRVLLPGVFLRENWNLAALERPAP